MNVNETSALRERIAACGCGSLTAAARGEPVEVYACSCRDCQRRSGGAFTYAALYPEAMVAMAGEHKTFRRINDAGRWIETQFCPDCGMTVFFRGEALPGLIGIAIGCFADAEFPEPRRLYWASRRHRWLAQLADGVELVETQ